MAVLFMAWILSMRTISNREKSSPFECGFDPIHTARIPFSIRFFLLAIIFIVFDIEIVLLIPIPIIYSISNMPSIMISSFIFILILIVGLFHEWNQGSLEWSS
nr:NADH dehydrogenase subunit 3 [Bhawania goodei]